MYKIKIIEGKYILNNSIVNNKNNKYSYIVIKIKNNIKYIQYKLLNINAYDYLKPEYIKKYIEFYNMHINDFFYYKKYEINHILSYCDEYLINSFKSDLVDLGNNIDNKIEVLKEFDILKEEKTIK